MAKSKILSKNALASHDVVGLSKYLLGKVLVSRIDEKLTSGIIVETEAYRAPDDKACHAFQNKRTPRTETMFDEPGTAYVYICYGIHHLFNVVTAPKDTAHAILIRAIEPLEGLDVMRERRAIKGPDKMLVNGPGKFTVAMGIYKEHNAIDLCNSKSPIYIEDRGIKIAKTNILEGPRVGMSTAGFASNWPWRFRVAQNQYTSKPDQVFYPGK